MKQIIPIITAIIFLVTALNASAQNNRIRDNNSIGWYTTTGTINFNKKWSAHLEYQWRRENYISNWQQSLLRTGINYKANNSAILRIGYAWAETYPYGDYPVNAFGKTFSEHRMYEMATLTQRSGTLDISHRIMLEQRWLPRYLSAASTKPDQWMFMNRARYMLRLQQSLKGKTLEDKEPYIAAYDEILIGFGKNVNENIFDQNRFGLLLGYRFNPVCRIEGGYLSQVVQLSREVSGRNVFQHNNGFIISSIFNINL
ncbi:MAG: DUF2490 domain-containing protein [Chitinophagaceae bacterium]|nr:DUF2490 domain-containing protein [Chitinophagaceae bacterium]